MLNKLLILQESMTSSLKLFIIHHLQVINTWMIQPILQIKQLHI